MAPNKEWRVFPGISPTCHFRRRNYQRGQKISPLTSPMKCQNIALRDRFQSKRHCVLAVNIPNSSLPHQRNSHTRVKSESKYALPPLRQSLRRAVYRTPFRRDAIPPTGDIRCRGNPDPPPAILGIDPNSPTHRLSEMKFSWGSISGMSIQRDQDAIAPVVPLVNKSTRRNVARNPYHILMPPEAIGGRLAGAAHPSFCADGCALLLSTVSPVI